MTIVFILNSYGKSRYDKRIEDFIEKGYAVEVYAFNRYSDSVYQSSFPVEIIGTFDNSFSYAQRSRMIFPAVKSVINRYKGLRVLYYLFGLDVAMSFWLNRKKEPFVYEEGDLVHTYMNNYILRRSFETIDKLVIRKSLFTVFTSEGFPNYHFGKIIGSSVVLPNKIHKRVLELPNSGKDHLLDVRNLNIGFVGAPRFNKVLEFLNVACRCFPQHKFHIFGGPVPDVFMQLKSYSNMIFHGPFNTPDDLPEIYSQIDLVLSTYDTDTINVRYAEPNKLYEAIYFDTPILVSTGTFLSEKVNKLGVGYSIDVNEANVKRFIEGLTVEGINSVINNIKKIPKEFAINNACELFDRIDSSLASLDR